LRPLTYVYSYIGRLESRLLVVENLLATQASMSQLRNSATPAADDLIEQNGRRESVGLSSVSRSKRRREDSPSPAPGSSVSGEMFVNVSGGHLEDDTPAPDTVLDGMGALNLGDEDDYGYFGVSCSRDAGNKCLSVSQVPHLILLLLAM
jgi:hypothetical protein